jgi:hypothetical protein
MLSADQMKAMSQKTFRPSKTTQEDIPTHNECWVYRLPTTQANVSKKQYFTALVRGSVIL